MNNNTIVTLCPSRFVAVCAAATVLVALSGGAFAQEWRLQPELRVGYEHDDNARLRTEPAEVQEIDGFVGEALLGIGYATPRTTFNLTPRLRSRKYDETPDVDSNDGFLNLSWNHETLRSQFGIRGSYESEAVRTAERADADIDEDDPDDIPTDDSGVVLTNDRRDRLRLMPRWGYDLTERTGIGAQIEYLDVSYDDALAGFLVDYTDARFSANLSHEFTERTRWFIEGTVRQYENDANVNDVDGVGASLGFETEISERTRLRAKAGYEDTEQTDTGESDSNVVGDINVIHKFETMTFLAQYRRSISPGGNGRVAAVDSVNLNLARRFTERLSGGLGVRVYQRDGVGAQPGLVEERDTTEFRATIAYAVTRAFLVEGTYRFDRLDRTGLEGTADANIFNISLVYRPTAIVN